MIALFKSIDIVLKFLTYCHKHLLIFVIRILGFFDFQALFDFREFFFVI